MMFTISLDYSVYGHLGYCSPIFCRVVVWSTVVSQGAKVLHVNVSLSLVWRLSFLGLGRRRTHCRELACGFW